MGIADYTMLHSVSHTTQCDTVLRSVGNEHPLQKGQEVCTCELCFICFQFLPRIFILPVSCLYHSVCLCLDDLITIKPVASVYCFKIVKIGQRDRTTLILVMLLKSLVPMPCQCIFVWLMCDCVSWLFLPLSSCSSVLLPTSRPQRMSMSVRPLPVFTKLPWALGCNPVWRSRAL